MQLHFSKFAEKLIGKPFEGMSRMNTIELNAAIKYHSENFYFINPEDDFKLSNILQSVDALIKKRGVKSFVIDAWNKLDHQYDTNETQYISKQLDLIVKFCERKQVHCFLVAHPTKIKKQQDGNYEVPNLYSISGSANFYNKTANGITVYRDYNSTGTKIYVQKVKFKHWGETGHIDLGWDKHTGRYYIGSPDYTNWLIIEDNKTELKNNSDFINQGIITNNEDINF